MTIRINYSNKEFTTILNDIQTQLNVDADWNDWLQSNVGRMLTEMPAAIGDMLAFYLDRQAAETYIPTVEIRNNAIGLLRLIGYRFQFPHPASITLQFNRATIGVNNVVIPRYTQVTTADNIRFVTIEDATIVVGQLSVQVAGVQGGFSSFSFTSTGQPSQSVTTVISDCAEGYFSAYVNEVEWPLATDNTFAGYTRDDEVFTLDQSVEGTLIVRFGDGIEGKIPPMGMTVRVQYLQTLGTGGRVRTGRVTGLPGNFTDSVGIPVALSVINVTPSSGGQNTETLAHAKANYPSLFKTLRRAVTKEDYEALVRGITEVVQVHAVDLNDNPELHFYQLKVYVIGSDGLPSDPLNASVQKLLDLYSYNSSVVDVLSPIIVPIMVEAKLNIYRQHNVTTVISNVTTTIQTFFTPTADPDSEIKIGKTLFLSRLITAISEVAGVSAVDLLQPTSDVIANSSDLIMLSSLNVYLGMQV